MIRLRSKQAVERPSGEGTGLPVIYSPSIGLLRYFIFFATFFGWRCLLQGSYSEALSFLAVLAEVSRLFRRLIVS